MKYAEKLYFHNTDKNNNPTSVFDFRILEHVKETVPLFICGGVPYIYDKGYYREDIDGTVLKSFIMDHVIDTFIKSNTITRIYNLFLQDRTLRRDPEELNHYDYHWINFRNGLYDARSGRVVPHDPRTLSINQVPHEYTPDGPHGDGDAIETFLAYAVPDPEDREMLLQYIGLCCTFDTSQQKMLILTGTGGTGKSTLINLIQDIVGYRNISNVALSDLEQRFSSIALMGKLLNSCADLEIDALDQVGTIKKLIGDDKIKGEHKGKDLVSFTNYAKLLFSTNELPLIKNEKTDGLYRRLLILTMNNKPTKRDPSLPEKLRSQLPYLLHLSMQALMRMYQKGTILNSANSQQAIQQLNKDSDTVEAFIQDECTLDASAKVKKSDLYALYEEYCKNWDRQSHSRQNFYKALRSKGIGEKRDSNGRYFYGIRHGKEDADGFMKLSESADIEDMPFND